MRSNHYSRRSEQNLRARIAQEAARVIIEDGILSYQAAKLKASKNFAIPNTESCLPCNEDIDYAMQQYHQIYSGEQQQQRLARQRRAALDAMEFLKDYSPRLTGPVLTGVSGQHSAVILHVFSDSPESIIINLMDAGIPFVEKSHDTFSPKGKPESFSRLCMQVDEIAIELLLFPYLYLRHKTKTKGLLTQLATIQQVRKLLDEPSAKTGFSLSA